MKTLNNSIILYNDVANENRLTATPSLSGRLLNEFIAYLQVAQASSDTYLKCIRQFFAYLDLRDISAPTEETVLEYKAYLKENGYTPATMQIYIISVKKFFTWTEKKNYYPNIAKDIKSVKVDKMYKKDALTVKQVRDVLAEMPNETVIDIRNKAIITLMVTCGLRDIEVVRANVEDIRTKGSRRVLMIQGKGENEKSNFVVIPEYVEEIIREYFKARGTSSGSDPLFASHGNRNVGGRMTTRSVNRIAKKAFIAIGLNDKRITAHSLRHTAVTTALLQGVPIEEVSQFARHKNIATTMIYNHAIEMENNRSSSTISEAFFGKKKE